jgi:predicted acylesterase/phospholipase RssA
MSFASLELRAGPRAIEHVRRQGIAPADIACVPAAAGGPKGLALVPLDIWLFGDWLREARDLELVGASIGAWRMAAAAQANPVAALERLSEGYIAQRFPREPTPHYVSEECRRLAVEVLGGARAIAPRAGVALSVITARARGVLHDSSSKPAFARAAFANALSRRRLAAHLERVVFGTARTPLWVEPIDAFGFTPVPLTENNTEDALLASGSIPIVCEPVRDPAGAPRGLYWDGGLIDYHLLLPYPRLAPMGGRTRLTLYPHFVPQVTPGWLDKHLPWRRHPRAHPWLDTMLLVAPSRAFVHRLPQRRLPDRNDFYRYGQDNERRMRDWRTAIAECRRFADDAARWLSAPDPTLLKPL